MKEENERQDKSVKIKDKRKRWENKSAHNPSRRDEMKEESKIKVERKKMKGKNKMKDKRKRWESGFLSF